ncbi:MAG: type II toxin-antitoxin system RelE/ParE family toxin [Bryobacterales bacterium]|nr:type II toxin-antitoxin system RelE/ParE family toxin [Acidobacteriota bacterium]MCB9383197.1 type II toxin-antitoxin system RelE/ParE family toxin [Bryobacterales bacterium]
MRRRFVLTPEARSDLAEIVSEIADDSPDAAERVRVALFEELRELARFPGIGHYHDELLNREYRFWNFGSYVVVYVWQAKPIQVIAVVHGARDLSGFLGLRVGRGD